MTDHGKSLSPSQKTDASIKGSIDHAIWNDDILRADVKYQILEQLPRPPFVIALQEQALWEQLLANDSLGG